MGSHQRPKTGGTWPFTSLTCSAGLKDYNVIADGQNFFDQPTKNDLRTYHRIQKILINQGNDYTTGFLISYPYFKENCTLTTMDLSKQQRLDADS